MAKSTRSRVVLVTRCFVVRKKKILVMQRAKNDTYLPGKSECPGGKLDPEQTLTNAFVREMLEETGLYVNLVTPHTLIHDEIVTKGKHKRLAYLVFFSVGVIQAGTLHRNDEHDAAKFVNYNKLLKLDLTYESELAATLLKKQICDTMRS